MARAKRLSDEVYNARRRAKRLLARMEREGVEGMSALQKRARSDYFKSLREQIQRSYQGSVRTVTEDVRKRVQTASDTLDRMTAAPRRARTRRERSDLMFQRQLNLARIGADSTLGEHAGEQVSVFYAATRQYWRGRDPEARNRLIMEGLGATSLAEAFERVMSANRAAYESIISKGEVSSIVDGITSENADFYGEVDIDPEMLGSAVWASKLVMFG